ALVGAPRQRARQLRQLHRGHALEQRVLVEPRAVATMAAVDRRLVEIGVAAARAPHPSQPTESRHTFSIRPLRIRRKSAGYSLPGNVIPAGPYQGRYVGTRRCAAIAGSRASKASALPRSVTSRMKMPAIASRSSAGTSVGPASVRTCALAIA